MLSLVACGGGGTGDNNTSGGMTKEEMLRESVAITFEDLPGSGNMAKAKQEIGKMEYYISYLRGLREDNDLTQKEVAEILGTSQTMYARYEQ